MNFSYYEHYISLCLHEIKLIKTVITVMLLKQLLHVSARAGRHQVQIYKTKFWCAASVNRPRSLFLQFCCKKGLIKYDKIEFTTEPWWRAPELVPCDSVFLFEHVAKQSIHGTWLTGEKSTVLC